jgi:hypothetical protein
MSLCAVLAVIDMMCCCSCASACTSRVVLLVHNKASSQLVQHSMLALHMCLLTDVLTAVALDTVAVKQRCFLYTTRAANDQVRSCFILSCDERYFAFYSKQDKHLMTATYAVCISNTKLRFAYANTTLIVFVWRERVAYNMYEYY